MPAPAPRLRELICPHGTHRVFAGAEALAGLRYLKKEQREKVARAFCELGEIAELRASVVQFWEETMLRLQVDSAQVLYSVDRHGAVLVHHVDAQR